jgi:thymidylate kinase
LEGARPLKHRPTAFTVALVGPDGVGKTTIARRLEAELPLALKYLYMGDNVEACNVMLPTTRWWKRRRRGRVSHPGLQPQHGGRRGGRRWWRRPAHIARRTLGFTNRLLEEAYREMVAASYFRRGTIVIFDRHFVLDYYHFDIDPRARPRSAKRRLHGWILRRFSRPPDLVVCLDAPGDVVYRRKGEFTPEFLEMRRWQYRDFQRLVDHFALVDANRDLELVVGDVAGVITRFHRERQHAN